MENVKKLGFGMMRLPRSEGKIDIEETKRMVDAFMEGGFNYFDTAFVYQGSEDAVREALVERHPRTSYYLATKCAVWAGTKTSDDAKAEFVTSLSRTGAGYFDFYLLHALDGERSRKCEEWGLWDYFSEKKDEGLIRHLGFSFHSTPEELDEILTKHPETEFVQLQINWADWENPKVESRRCLEVAVRHGKRIIVMEPVKGGLLAFPHDSVRDVFRSFDASSSPSSWAIRFAADQEGVLTVLSGMSTMEQVEDNVRTMKDFNGFSPEERLIVEKAREVFSSIPSVPCTGCGYCRKVCPVGVAIPETFSAMNKYLQFNNLERARKEYSWSVKEKEDRAGADKCERCGACEEACPQHIAIRDELGKASAVLI